MAAVFGRNSFILLGEESTWGTPVATGVTNRVISTALTRTQERSQTTFLSTGDAGYSRGTFDGFEIAGGTIEMPLYYENTGMILKAALGDVTDSGAGPSYTHVYEPALTLPSLTIANQRGSGQSEKFEGCIVSSMSLSIEAGGEMTASFEVIAQTAGARTSAVTPTYNTTARQVLHFEAGQMSFNGNNYDLRSLTLNVDNKVDRRNFLGSKLTAEPATIDIREVTLECSCDVESTTASNIYNEQIAGVIGTVAITFTNSDADTFKIELFNAQLTAYDDAISTVGRLERTFSFQGFRSSSNPPVKITIVNQQSSGIAN